MFDSFIEACKDHVDGEILEDKLRESARDKDMKVGKTTRRQIYDK